MVYGWVIITNQGEVYFDFNTNELWFGGNTNCVLAVFNDRNRARRIAQKIKKEWDMVTWTKTVMAMNVSGRKLKLPST